MILNIFVTRDRKISAYGRPIFTADAPDMLIETLRRSIVGRPLQNLHLADCELFSLGTFDDVSGVFTLLDQPEFLEDLHKYFPNNVEAIINGIDQIKN